MEIKKCPFCKRIESVYLGNENEHNCADEIECAENPDPYYAVVCSVNRGGCGGSGGYYPTSEQALAAWNRRADGWIPVSMPPAPGQVVIACLGDDHYELLTYHTRGDELYDEAAAPDVRYAELDGFYLHEKNDGLIECRRHADIITHWQPLPDRPRKEQNDEVL